MHACTAKHLGYFNHILGCLSCISVTKECYQIGFFESSLRSFFIIITCQTNTCKILGVDILGVGILGVDILGVHILGVDILGVHILGVDILEVHILGRTPRNLVTKLKYKTAAWACM